MISDVDGASDTELYVDQDGNVYTDGLLQTGSDGTDGSLKIFSEQGGTDFTYTINPHAAATQNVTLTLPADDGTSDQVLTTNGSGALSWSTAGGGSEVFDSGTTGATSSGMVTTNFNSTYTSAPIVVITPTSAANYGNAKQWPHVSATSTTSFTITANVIYEGATFNWIAIGG